MLQIPYSSLNRRSALALQKNYKHRQKGRSWLPQQVAPSIDGKENAYGDMDPSCSLAQARSAGAGKPSFVDNAIKARGHHF